MPELITTTERRLLTFPVTGDPVTTNQRLAARLPEGAAQACDVYLTKKAWELRRSSRSRRGSNSRCSITSGPICPSVGICASSVPLSG